MRLVQALAAYDTPDFKAAFKREVEQLDAALLPLQQGLTHSSRVADSGFAVMVIGVEDDADSIRVKAGIFYAGVIAGCNCADDPTPPNEQSEYCEVLFDIDRHTAATTLALIGY